MMKRKFNEGKQNYYFQSVLEEAEYLKIPKLSRRVKCVLRKFFCELIKNLKNTSTPYRFSLRDRS